jgi:hypothetical protein
MRTELMTAFVDIEDATKQIELAKKSRLRLSEQIFRVAKWSLCRV